jgi:hypothetical protein plarl_07030
VYNIELDAKLLSLLPPWYREILDYQEICRVEEEQFAALAENVKSVANNFFFQTMDESAISQWEQVLAITPDSTTEDLEFRRVRILNRLSTRPPFTIGFLYQKLDELIGIDKWEATVEALTIDLLVDYEVVRDEPKRLTELMNLLLRILPAHIEVKLSRRIIGEIKNYSALHGGVLTIMYGEVIL